MLDAQRAEGPSLQSRKIRLEKLPWPPLLDSWVERAGMGELLNGAFL